MIVVHENTAFRNIMQAKDGQDFKKCEAISGGIIGEGGLHLYEYEIGDGRYFFLKASRKADAEAAIPLYVSGSDVHSLSGMWNGLEMIRI